MGCRVNIKSRCGVAVPDVRSPPGVKTLHTESPSWNDEFWGSGALWPTAPELAALICNKAIAKHLDISTALPPHYRKVPSDERLHAATHHVKLMLVLEIIALAAGRTSAG